MNSQPNLAGLEKLTADSRDAALDNDTGPGEPTDYHALLGRLQAAKPKLPLAYRETVAEPFFEEIQALGEGQFQQILMADPERKSTAGLMLDIAQAILQDGEGFNALQTDAFEEVVSDLYDGFLSAQDRNGIKTPDHAQLPPMVKWGNPDSGPYTWPIDATSNFGLEAAVVNMPPGNARRGLAAWSALGHETAGHDILHADAGLQAEFARNLRRALHDAKLPALFASYWATRIDETSSDVMGILNMGPAAGIGMIAFFRGLNAAFGDGASLRTDGPASDEHPADILRGYLAASTVRRLSFAGAGAWADAIEKETDTDVAGRAIFLEDRLVSVADAKKSADVVAEVLTRGPTEVLQHHALLDIQDWRDADEATVGQLRGILARATPLDNVLAEGIFAAHAVSAAVLAALAGEAEISVLLGRMLRVLKAMHDRNPVNGPLPIAHAGDIHRDLAFVPAKAITVEEAYARIREILIHDFGVPADDIAGNVTLSGLALSPTKVGAAINQQLQPKHPLTDQQVTADPTIGRLAYFVSRP